MAGIGCFFFVGAPGPYASNAFPHATQLAVEIDGIVVSNDNYRDLTAEHPDFKRLVNERLLMYSFVSDRFMPPDDPLGRSGPTLDNFLRVHSK